MYDVDHAESSCVLSENSNNPLLYAWPACGAQTRKTKKRNRTDLCLCVMYDVCVGSFLTSGLVVENHGGIGRVVEADGHRPGLALADNVGILTTVVYLVTQRIGSGVDHHHIC